jgi:hypothetical protein
MKFFAVLCVALVALALPVNGGPLPSHAKSGLQKRSHKNIDLNKRSDEDSSSLSKKNLTEHGSLAKRHHVNGHNSTTSTTKLP